MNLMRKYPKPRKSKAFLFVSIALIGFVGGFAKAAQSFSEYDSDQNSVPAPHGKHAAKMARKTITKPDQLAIKGVCRILPSASNPLPGFCINIVLVLLDTQGPEVVRVRTTDRGEFEFTAASGKTYHIVAASKFYEVASPTEAVRAGDSLQIQLRAK